MRRPDRHAWADAPYWLFDPGDTALNVTDPLLIATYHGKPGTIETWHTTDDRVRELKKLLLRGARETRGLRSTNRQRAHPKLNLGRGSRSNPT